MLGIRPPAQSRDDYSVGLPAECMSDGGYWLLDVCLSPARSRCYFVTPTGVDNGSDSGNERRKYLRAAFCMPALSADLCVYSVDNEFTGAYIKAG